MPQKKSAFYYFMKDKQPEYAARFGRPVQMGEMKDLVSEEWEKMSKEERDQYKAKRDKDPVVEQEKYTSEGVKVSDIERRLKEKDEFIKSMNNTIGNTLSALSVGGGIKDAIFHVFNIQYFCEAVDSQTKCTIYVPAEISIIKFSLQDGIIDSYHKILKSNTIPLGYQFTAREYSDEHHRLFPTTEIGEDFDLEELLNFISMGGTPSPLYTKEGPSYEELDMQTDMLNGLVGMKLEIYSLNVLYVDICRALRKYNISRTIADHELNKRPYSHKDGLGCKIHRLKLRDAVDFCSQAICQFWLYGMFSYIEIEEHLGIRYLPYYHKPGQPDKTRELGKKLDKMKLDPKTSNAPKTLKENVTPNPGLNPLSEENFPTLGASKGRGKIRKAHVERAANNLGNNNAVTESNLRQIGNIRVPDAAVTPAGEENVWNRRPMGRGKRKPDA